LQQCWQHMPGTIIALALINDKELKMNAIENYFRTKFNFIAMVYLGLIAFAVYIKLT
jgi:hypothetical protein